MRVTKGAAVFVGLLYVFLWVLAVNGVSSLVPLLAVPAVLAVLVAFGVWLNRFMGITPRRQHFEDPVGPGADAADVPPTRPDDTGDAAGSPPR